MYQMQQNRTFVCSWGKGARRLHEVQEILPGRPLAAFLQSAGSGWNEGTQATYRRALQELQGYMAAHGPPTVQSLQAWRQSLRETYSLRSINLRIAAANHYFRWCERPDLVMHHERPAKTPSPELSRSEYLRLLRAARAQGQRQLYLLVKLFALTGLPLQCLGQVTAAVVRAGGGELSCRGQPFALCLPDSLQRELLAYMEEQRTGSGPLFVSRSGRVVNRSHLCRSIQELCRTAGVPEEKGSPRCLRALWRSTQDRLHADMEQQIRNIYSLLLQAEEETAGWSAGA